MSKETHELCHDIFCHEDGTREFEKALKCPACDTELQDKYDIVRLDLNPSEQYKSMVLAGLRPEIVMDVCSRAMSFWTYQIHQETTYQEYVVRKLRDRCTQLEEFYDQTITKSKTEINAMKHQLESIKKELESHRKKSTELSEKLLEKNRQLQKLQNMYEHLRRKCISPAIFEKAGKNERRTLIKQTTIPLTTLSDMLHHSSDESTQSHRLMDSQRFGAINDGEFFIQPMSTVTRSAPTQPTNTGTLDGIFPTEPLPSAFRNEQHNKRPQRSTSNYN